MKGIHLNKILQLEVQKAYYSEYGNWYDKPIGYPVALFDKAGYTTFNSEEHLSNFEGVVLTKRLNIRKGISSLKGYKKFTNAEKLLIESLDLSSGITEKEEDAIAQRRLVSTRIRKQELVKSLKKKYNYTCQICGQRLQIGPDRYYAEVHHIKPLGSPHNGPDNKSNMICVCPNHHVQLDMGFLKLDKATLKLNKHNLKDEYISYHNNVIAV